MYLQIVGAYIKRRFDSVDGDYLFVIPRFKNDLDVEIDGYPIAIGYDSSDSVKLAGRVASAILGGQFIENPQFDYNSEYPLVIFTKKTSMNQIYSYLSSLGY